jgi:hypothetical protein
MVYYSISAEPEQFPAYHVYHPIAGDDLQTSKTRAVSRYNPFSGNGLQPAKPEQCPAAVQLLVMVYYNQKNQGCVLLPSHCW